MGDIRVIIRTDGNKEIAMGHIMRCLSIGAALKKAGADVVFVTAGQETRELIAARGFEQYVLHTAYQDMEAELTAFHALFEQKPADWILIDSYFVTPRYMKELSGWTRTAYMDDMGLPVYPLSMLINYNIYGTRLPYTQWYENAGITLPEQVLLGCAYAPLREEFQQGHCSRVKQNVTDVLITTGGGDLVNAAGGLCRRLETEIGDGRHQGVYFHVVCGPFSENKQELYALAERAPAFVIHENVTHMSELMADCDIAVSAAGSTMYELCSMQLPAICFYFAENQRQMAECFGDMTSIINAGNITLEQEHVLESICNGLTALEQDGALRARIRSQMQELTDGGGAVRIATALLAANACR